MTNLLSILGQTVVVPYMGGGVDITQLPSGGIIFLVIVILLLMSLVAVIAYDMNKEEFFEESLGWQYRAMTIIIDILGVIIGLGGGGLMIYLCFNELITRI